MVFKNEGPVAWLVARELAHEIEMLICTLPKPEFHCLGLQIKKAADAIVFHIAEVKNCRCACEFVRNRNKTCVEIMQVVFYLCVARKRGHISQANFHQFSNAYKELSTALATLRWSAINEHQLANTK